MTLNKSLLASAMCMCMALPSYADIASNANSATCDNTTIGATSGSTGLEANWNANTITIDWYNGDTKITTNTCSYDGAVTIPATPTKAGYTFNGWKVKAAKQCWELPDDECCDRADCNFYESCVAVAASGCSAITDSVLCNNSVDTSDKNCYWSSGTCIGNGVAGPSSCM